jgi:plasmid stabilization system protein ParE
MKVLIEEEALDDLDEIYAWKARDDPASADATIDRIFDDLERLARLPRLGHHGRARNTFERVVRKSSHVVVYKIVSDSDELVVIGVFSGSQEIRRP